MDDEMIKRMAGAILVEAYKTDGMVIRLGVATAISKAVAKAMREPTNVMHKAMCDAYNSPAAIWLAGIDAITNDQ